MYQLILNNPEGQTVATALPQIAQVLERLVPPECVAVIHTYYHGDYGGTVRAPFRSHNFGQTAVPIATLKELQGSFNDRVEETVITLHEGLPELANSTELTCLLDTALVTIHGADYNTWQLCSNDRDLLDGVQASIPGSTMRILNPAS